MNHFPISLQSQLRSLSGLGPSGGQRPLAREREGNDLAGVFREVATRSMSFRRFIEKPIIPSLASQRGRPGAQGEAPSEMLLGRVFQSQNGNSTTESTGKKRHIGQAGHTPDDTYPLGSGREAGKDIEANEKAG